MRLPELDWPLIAIGLTGALHDRHSSQLRPTSEVFPSSNGDRITKGTSKSRASTCLDDLAS